MGKKILFFACLAVIAMACSAEVVLSIVRYGPDESADAGYDTEIVRTDRATTDRGDRQENDVSAIPAEYESTQQVDVKDDGGGAVSEDTQNIQAGKDRERGEDHDTVPAPDICGKKDDLYDADGNTEENIVTTGTGDDITVIFRPDLPKPRGDMDSQGTTFIIKPKEVIKLDPSLADKLRKHGEEKEKEASGLFRTMLAVEQTEEGLVLKFSLENISETDLEYYSGSSQKYDYSIYDSNGNEVYRWSNDKDFLAVITEMLIRKGEKASFREIWDYTGNDGKRVPHGEYSVVVRMIAKLNDGRKTDPGELTAKAYFTVD